MSMKKIINELNLAPPSIKEIDIIGIQATTYNKIFAMEDTNFPVTMEIGDIQVVIMISKVCLSLSPEMEEAVNSGVTKMTMTL